MRKRLRTVADAPDPLHETSLPPPPAAVMPVAREFLDDVDDPVLVRRNAAFVAGFAPADPVDPGIPPPLPERTDSAGVLGSLRKLSPRQSCGGFFCQRERS